MLRAAKTIVLQGWDVENMRMMIILESDAGILGKKKSECSYQESNLRPSDYWFGCSTTELQETRGS